jgi:hypothetical protein
VSLTQAIPSPGLSTQASSERAEISIPRYLVIAFELGLFLVVVYLFNIESRGFLHLGILAFFGWLIHYFLPLRYRLPFFLFLSLTGIGLVFGLQAESWSAEGLAQAAWTIGLGLVLIALCHVPGSNRVRISLLAAVVIALAAARAGAVATPWSAAIWPVLGSMFMFRLVVYLQQVRQSKTPPTVARTLSYFFMLPNVCFPLFPVVDYHTFLKSHYDSPDRHRIYQTGIHWLFRGIVHLLLYRLIYQNLIVDASDVATRFDLVNYLLWPYTLYLRVSGTFHLIAGMMHLFGFNLPETHKLYFLSSSFNDFWRRINIYWKDFIMKVFYYPIYFRLRQLGNVAALVISTMLAFFATWILHGYQWFWLRGTWLLTWNDALFWAILGALVVANSLYEIEHGRTRRLAGTALSWRSTLLTSARTIGVFFAICILWSLWSAQSLAQWLGAWSAALRPSDSDVAAAALLFGFIAVIGVSALVLARGVAEPAFAFGRSAAVVISSAAIIIGISFPEVHRNLGPAGRTVAASLMESELNRGDFANLERGYYENLMDVGGFNSELWEIYRAKPADWRPVSETDGVEPIDGLPFFSLKPSVTFSHNGVQVTTNRWGMRDRDYPKERSQETVRVALLGSSFVFGNGVGDEETFENLLEDRLNEEAARFGGPHYELMNFGVGGYSDLENLHVLENRACGFDPDFVFLFFHSDTRSHPLGKLANLMLAGQPLHYPFLEEIVRRAGVDENDVERYREDRYALMQKLRPYEQDILERIYAEIAAAARECGARPIAVFIPRPEKFDQGGIPELESGLAREAGMPVLDLSGAYGESDLAELWIARWDHHPNAAGTRLLADRLYQALKDSQPSTGFQLPMASQEQREISQEVVRQR